MSETPHQAHQRQMGFHTGHSEFRPASETAEELKRQCEELRKRVDGLREALVKIGNFVDGESDDPDGDIARMQDIASAAVEEFGGKEVA